MTQQQGRLIAIASGKGGVGKTWLAVTLAQAMSHAGRSVLLADGDVGLANVDVQLGLRPELDMVAVLAGRATLAEAVLHHAGGFDVLPGRSGSGSFGALSDAAMERLTALLAEARLHWDVVLLDLGAGVDPGTRRLAALADTLLVVTTPEPTALTDAYAVLKLHGRDRPDGDARIVVNQARDQPAGKRAAATLRRAAAQFLDRDIPLAAILRLDERVPEAISRQTPLLTRHPTSPAGEDVEALARRLTA
ncbi:MAG: AAA family ATPase [Acetobacteraceae bacterium]|nr:AAA family ATPase [Acetobacteraceae bacterium]